MENTAQSLKADCMLPDLYCRSITDIPFKSLYEKGIVNFCIDLDNTLALRKSSMIEPNILKALKNAAESGYIKNICIVSNIIFGKKRRARVKNAADQLNTPFFYAADFWNRKPKAAPYLKAMEMMKASAENTAMIGDQIFTDMLGAKRLGMYAVLVKPLGPDHWATSLTGRRQRERKILQSLKIYSSQ